MFMSGLLLGGTFLNHFLLFISDPSEPTHMNAESATIVQEFLSHSRELTSEIERDTKEMIGVIPFIFQTLKECPDTQPPTNP